MAHPTGHQGHTSLPVTPANRMTSSLDPPLTPTRVPLPPSASNFLNQNHFTLSNNIRDTPPHFYRHPSYPSRRFVDPNQRGFTYPVQPPPVYPPPVYPPPNFCPPPFYPPYPYYSQPQQPQHGFQPSQPPYLPMTAVPSSFPSVLPFSPSVVPVVSPSTLHSPKTLPTVTHIPILSGRTDFGAWNDGVRALIQHLGYTGHISNPPASGVAPRPEHIPTFPPVLSADPTVSELAAYKQWWECDNVVTHVLLARLHSIVRAILPSDDDDDTTAPRTSRMVYTVLRKTYSVHGHASGSALYTELRNLLCGSRVQEYVTKWRGGVSQLRSARHHFSVRDVIEAFLDKLPTSIPYQILRFKYMDQIDSVSVTDIEMFFKITDEVLDIDSLHKRTNVHSTSSQRPPLSRPTAPAPSTLPSMPTSLSTSAVATTTASRPARSSLVCSNCHVIGHTVDRCFRSGGGLEGKRDEYLASVGRAQAHLAQLMEVIECNEVAADTVPPDIPVQPDPDVIVESAPTPAFSALSLTPTVVSDAVVNEDLYFEAYSCLSLEFAGVFSAISTVDLSLGSHPSLVLPVALSAGFPYNSVLDSGCTHHIFRERDIFWTYDPSQATQVKTANCGFLPTLARGSVRFRVTSGTRTVVFILKDCLHAPDAPINLISVGALTEKGATLTFAPNQTTISFPPSHPLLPDFSFIAFPFRRLSFLNCDFVPPSASSLPVSPFPPVSSFLSLSDLALLTAFPPLALTPALWHRRFGHLGQAATRAILTKDYVTGLEYTGSFDQHHCIPCLIGKRPQLPYASHSHRTGPGELLHVDTCGPFPTLSTHKHSSFLEVLEDHSNFGYLGLLHKKDDAFGFYCETEAKVELTTGSLICAVRMDGAPELCEGKMGRHLRGRGISLQVAAPYAHAQNGKVERYIRTLEDTMQALLADSSLPPSFWNWAVSTAQYLRNHLPTSVLPSGVTPFEAHHHRKPDLSHLRVWGCQCFVLVPPELQTKGGPRQYEAIFVG